MVATTHREWLSVRNRCQRNHPQQVGSEWPPNSEMRDRHHEQVRQRVTSKLDDRPHVPTRCGSDAFTLSAEATNGTVSDSNNEYSPSIGGAHGKEVLEGLRLGNSAKQVHPRSNKTALHRRGNKETNLPRKQRPANTSSF